MSNEKRDTYIKPKNPTMLGLTANQWLSIDIALLILLGGFLAMLIAWGGK